MTLVEQLERVREFISPNPYETDPRKAPTRSEALRELDEAIAVLRGVGFQRLGISAPSHLTIPQVARALDVTTSAIKDRIRRGTMNVEAFNGTKMIHVSQVLRAVEKRREGGGK